MADPAPGGPGIAPTWTSSAKDLVTTACEGSSRLWATLGLGIVNEVFWPSTGSPQIRDLGFIIGFDDGHWVEIKRARSYTIGTPRPYTPLPEVVHEGPGYRLVLEILPDPQRDVLLIRRRLTAKGKLYVLLAPHLGSSGWDNTAWVEDELYAAAGDYTLCLAAEHGFSRASAGYVGSSDGWQDFHRNGRMTWTWARAETGNVALMGELPNPDGVLALGFAEHVEGARLLARSSIAQGYDDVRGAFVQGWRQWGEGLDVGDAPPRIAREALLSATVIKVHDDRNYPGSVVASLSTPWGNASNDPGGYHLVWTRDAVEAGLAFLAVGRQQDARRMLAYLIATQLPDGRWAQNHFPDGRPYWTGIQLDEIGFPLIYAAKLLELGVCLRTEAVEAMVRSAVTFLARNGPSSPQDRWEENAGVSPFTLAVEVAALVAAVEFVDPDEDAYLLSLADYWNERIEDWTFVTGGPLAKGEAGYYVRLAPTTEGAHEGRIDVRNRVGVSLEPGAMVGLEFMYLARLGLRRAKDEKLEATLAVVERELRVDTPMGPAYHRYNEDGYGEHADGSPFDGTGIGRAWPLLTGERGHFELLRGGDPMPYLDAMTAMTGPGGLLPEQVWDTAPIPERFLVPGKPSGSAMPLVWAHAELLKLVTAAKRGEPLEMLEAVRSRYNFQRPEADTWHWRVAALFTAMPAGRDLLVEHDQRFILHHGFDGWQGASDLPSAPLPFGLQGVRLERSELAGHHSVQLALRDAETGQRIGEDCDIKLVSRDTPS